jgi:hypothetical protein
MQIHYLPATDNFEINFEQVLVFPADILSIFFANAGLVGPQQTLYEGCSPYLTGVICTEEQWVKFVQFRRDSEKDNPEMYASVDKELNNFLMYAAKVRPHGSCALQ